MTPPRPRSALFGIAIMASTISVMPLMDAFAKLLTVDMTALQIVWGRFLVQALLPLPFLIWGRGIAGLRPRKPGLQILRTLLLVVSSTLFFAALASLPLANALAMFFIYPFVVTALSPALLGERVGPWRWSAVIAGFLGALIVIRPGEQFFATGAPLALAAAVLFGLSMLVTRKVALGDPPFLSTMLTGAIGLAVLSPVMPLVWHPPSYQQWLLLLGVGVIAIVGQAGVLTAHRHATPATLAPIGYVEIVSGTLLGYLIWRDLPDALDWLGIAVIITSGIVIAWREHRHRRKAGPIA